MTQPNIDDYWTGPAVWLPNPAGYAPGAMAFIGPVVWLAGIEPGVTNTAQAVFGPGGGQFQGMPPIKQGAPGFSPTLRNLNVINVPYGEALPVPNGDFIEVTPGAPGVPPVYDAEWSVQGGQPGDVGSYLISGAEDLIGELEQGVTMVWNAVTNAFNPAPLPFTAWYNVTGIETTTTAAGEIRTLAPLSIPPFDYAYMPVVFAQCEVFGTINTKVDLVARIGGALNEETGTEIGRGFGTQGATPPPPSIIPSGTGLFDGGYGQVAADQGATIYLNCEQQDSTTDEYSTGRCTFSVGIAPVGT